jgi:hypothetical protein
LIDSGEVLNIASQRPPIEPYGDDVGNVSHNWVGLAAPESG